MRLLANDSADKIEKSARDRCLNSHAVHACPAKRPADLRIHTHPIQFSEKATSSGPYETEFRKYHLKQAIFTGLL